MSAPSIRTLAARLKLSHATVSEALRGSPRVKEATRLRVIEEAARMGYRPDPIASELMAQMRRSRSQAFRGFIALVAPEEDARLSPAQRRRRLLLRQCAEKRAAEFGFKVDPVVIGADGWSRLPGVLHARGVVGALLLPSDHCRAEHRALFAAADYPTVYADAPEEGAEHLDAVAPDYRQALVLARSRLAALGYFRPGLVLAARSDSAANLRWRAAYEALASAEASPRLRLPAPLQLEASFAAGAALELWTREHGIDVLLAEETLPGRVGLPLCLLDVVPGSASPLGVELRWADVASRAVDLIVRQYFDRLRGLRESPAVLSLPALWRAAPAASPSEEPVKTPRRESRVVAEFFRADTDAIAEVGLRLAETAS